MKVFDLLVTCSKKGVVAANEQWKSARNQGLLQPKDLSRRDALDLQILASIFMKTQGTLTLEFLEKGIGLAGQAGIPPETQVVYLGFLFDLAHDAGIRGLKLKVEVRAKGYDWEVADALSNVSKTFDRRVAKLREAVGSSRDRAALS